MLKGLPTILIVTAVASAIWIVAEAESIREESLSRVVSINATPANGAIARADTAHPWTGAVSITLDGSTSALDTLARALEQNIPLSPGHGLPVVPGVYQIDLRDALESLPIFRDAGVTIRQVDPPEVWVEVAEHEIRQVQVAVDTSDLNLEATPTIDPPTVTIAGPKHLIDRLTAASVATVTIPAEVRQGLVPGQPRTLQSLRPRLPAEIPIAEFWGSDSITPSTVSVTLTPRVILRSHTVPGVSVLLSIPPVDYNEWEIQVPENDRFLRDVTLTGPSDIISQYERGERRLEATVRLLFQDLEAALAAGGTITREADIGPLPTGVTAQCDDKFVQVTVQRRDQTAQVPTASEN
ncbi:MAG: hypothetical protein KDA05_07775 [Phycisphaerales bacterium]|nr:hypothetical protein [Phycisphaerales bacterium]